MEKKTIGGFIAALRRSQGMTQQELADRLSVSNKTISKWECGDSYPEITLVPVIAEVFGVTSDEILKGERVSEKPASAEKTIAKAELQIKRLILSSISKFKTLSLISVGLFLTGYVVLMVMSFEAYEPVIGFGVMSLFVIAGVMLEIINVSRVFSVLNSDEGLQGGRNLLVSGFETLFKNAQNVFSIATALVLISLPAIITFEVEWPFGIENMTGFAWYLYSARHLALVAIVLYWISRLTIRAVLAGKEQYSGVSVFSHDVRVTIAQTIVSALFIILML